ncbi:MAG: endonuclease III [Candidatus Omnitrophota bacterium]
MKPIKIRVVEIIKTLRKLYPKSRTALCYRSPLEILVATILSAQCTDKRVNKVTPGLFKKYKNVYGFSRAKQASLEKDIHSCGFFRSKAKNIIASSRRIVEVFSGKVPDTIDDLLTLPGVARKTANIVLSSAFKKSEGIAVDTHVKRLSGRLGLSKNLDPNKIEEDLLKIVPKKYWIDFNYILVDHGRAICDARKPLCSECAIRKLCPSLNKI